MSDSSMSIQLLFTRDSLKVPELLEAASGAVKKGVDLVAQGKQVTGDALTPSFWLTSANRVVDMVGQLTDVPLTDVLVGAWKVHQQFAKYAKPEFPKDKVCFVALATHHVKGSYEPYVEIEVDGAPAGTIKFGLELDICLEAGTLVIQAGRIKRLEAGRCRVTGTLKCEGRTVAERTSQDYAWSAGIPLGEGVPIESIV